MCSSEPFYKGISAASAALKRQRVGFWFENGGDAPVVSIMTTYNFVMAGVA
jgi:hypothetical protein